LSEWNLASQTDQVPAYPRASLVAFPAMMLKVSGKVSVMPKMSVMLGSCHPNIGSSVAFFEAGFLIVYRPGAGASCVTSRSPLPRTAMFSSQVGTVSN
jgi:hypothetical protein